MNIVDSICRRFVLRQLRNLRGDKLVIHDELGRHAFGGDGSQWQVEMQVAKPRFYRRVLFGGDLGFAESVMDGDCASEDLTALMRYFIRNAAHTERLDGGVAYARRAFSRFRHWSRRNTTANARSNIRAHYDLSNAFFALFLDETQNYSCGVFDEPSSDMADASYRKMHLACQNLQLDSGDRLLEIGTGWGALAELAARDYGCDVTTTTISQRQYEYASDRVNRAGLHDRVDLLLSDYRDLRGSFDKIVSIEMVEAVGHQFLGSFFSKCSQLLKRDGKFCLQAIVMADDRYDEYVRNIDFIRAYIFPGGCLPSVSALTTEASKSGLQLTRMEDFGPHYAETLRRWRYRFDENREAIRELGFDERFMRMWDYYLRYCEAAFDEHQVGLVQMVFEHRDRPETNFAKTNASFVADDGACARQSLQLLPAGPASGL